MGETNGPRNWWRAALLAGVLYVGLGFLTAELAQRAGSPTMARFWRLSAWPLSLVVFLGHLAYERRRRPALPGAWHVAVGAALGGFLLAVVGPVRSHWGQADFFRSALLSLPVWPVITGIPAFLLGFAGLSLLSARRA